MDADRKVTAWPRHEFGAPGRPMDVTDAYMQLRIETRHGQTEHKVYTPVEYIKVAGRPVELPPDNPRWWDMNLGFWDNYCVSRGHARWDRRAVGSMT